MKRFALLLALAASACATSDPMPIYDDWPAPSTSAPDYSLRPGEAQPFDPARVPATHRVGFNESLYDVAARYQSPVRALIEYNRLHPPYVLTPGAELRLPRPRVHIVAWRETFQDVARRYNVDPRSLALLNRMREPYRVRAGDRIYLPALARAVAPPPVPVRDPWTGGLRFRMPLSGPVVARPGAHPGGARLDGVEILGRTGDAVSAAADGEVLYAGDDLPAYGTLVLLRHAGDYVTAYGFNRRAVVRKGERVYAGQHIAELGPRPDGRARLLFQVRRGRAALDPMPLLWD